MYSHLRKIQKTQGAEKCATTMSGESGLKKGVRYAADAEISVTLCY